MMRISVKGTTVLTILALSLLGSGCRSATRPDLDPALVAGTYVLDAPVFRGPSSGTFVLTDAGEATRRAQYPNRDDPWHDRTFVGTFRLVRTDSIHFTLSENSMLVFQMGARRTGDLFTLRYPHPADGEVAEVYRRVSP